MDLLNSILDDQSIKSYLTEFPPEEWTAVIKRTLCYGIHSLKALEKAGFSSPSSALKAVTQDEVVPQVSARSTRRTPSHKKQRPKLQKTKTLSKRRLESSIKRMRPKENKDPEIRQTAEFSAGNHRQPLVDAVPRRLNPVELALDS